MRYIKIIKFGTNIRHTRLTRSLIRTNPLVSSTQGLAAEFSTNTRQFLSDFNHRKKYHRCTSILYHALALFPSCIQEDSRAKARELRHRVILEGNGILHVLGEQILTRFIKKC
jgi:hypothetical protein